jgi:hypothetical protein
MYEWFLDACVFLMKYAAYIVAILVGIATLINNVTIVRLNREVADLHYETLRLRSQFNAAYDNGAKVRIRKAPTVDIKPKPSFSLGDIEIIE